MKFGTLIGSAFMAAALSPPTGKRWYVVCELRFCLLSCLYTATAALWAGSKRNGPRSSGSPKRSTSPGLVPSEKAASFRPRPSLLLIGQAASAA